MVIGTLTSDLRYGARSLVRAPLFTLMAIVTFALGVGANAAVFSVVHAALLSPLPYPDADRLVRVWPERPLSVREFIQLQQETAALSGVAASSDEVFTVGGDGPAEEVAGAAVTTDYFTLLGARPALGRLFTAGDSIAGADPAVILSHEFWERRFGRDPSVVGRRIAIGGQGTAERRVVGVLTPDFAPASFRHRVWVPVTIDPNDEVSYSHQAFLAVVGRLRPSIPVNQASADVKAFAARLRQQTPEAFSEALVARAGVVPLQAYYVREVRSTVWLLAGAVVFVLLIACVNVTTMGLARAAGRSRELAVRAALGASRRRLVGQLLVESAMLGLAGGLVGAGLGHLAAGAVAGRLEQLVPGMVVGLDWKVLAFALATATAAGVAAGVVPAIRASRPAAGPLRAGAATADRRRRLVTHLLVTTEVAAAVVLTAGAALLIESMRRLQVVDPGFESARVLSLRVRPQAARYPDNARLVAYYRDLLDRLASVPDVEAAGAIHLLPLAGGNVRVLYAVGGRPLAAGTPQPSANYRIVTPGYFRAMGIPLRSGRLFGPDDREGAPPVGLINETMARQIDAAGNAVGRQLVGDDGEVWSTIVGVVADTRQSSLYDESSPELYLSYAQAGEFLSSMYLTVRTRRDPASLADPVQTALRNLDDQVAVALVRPMADVVRESLNASRQVTGLFGLFAALALALGAAGVYGVASQAVAQRTREIGVRMALGASRTAVFSRATREGLAPVAYGLMFGLVGSFWLEPLLANRLFDVAPGDPVATLAVAGVLLLVGAAACMVPARRASRVSPIEALRCD
ncbi:MAG TPA: ABC transporter permease [Vicinamibacterales bacterium]|nr:ABC transporter permease [Vicinamibacterales bacterium]